MRVSLCWAAPEGQFELPLELPSQACIADALAAARAELTIKDPAWADRIDWADAPVGVYGELRERGTRLRAGDRVEIYRALLVDPKESRRVRAQRLRRTPVRAGKPAGV